MFALTIVLGIVLQPPSALAQCDDYVDLVYDEVAAYDKKHRVYPVPQELQYLANRNMPRLFVHPESYRPVDYQDYLAKAKLKSLVTDEVVAATVTESLLQSFPYRRQCELYLEVNDSLMSPVRPPVYVQVFKDQMPGGPERQWIYMKYNYMFDWSGLAEEKSFLGKMGAFFTGGDERRWHRLDIHTAAVLAFDRNYIVRTLTLIQHNYQKTYLAGRDFSYYRPPVIVAAKDTNELYLDTGSADPVTYRVVTFLDDWEYLINPSASVTLWAQDQAYGPKAGAIEVPTRTEFVAPKFSLATFTGLLAPPRRILGMYIGRDGPPGYDYRGLPGYNGMPGLVAMGAWEYDDPELRDFLKGRLKGFADTDWRAIKEWLADRLYRQLIGP